MVKPILNIHLSETLKRLCESFPPALAVLQNGSKDSKAEERDTLAGLSGVQSISTPLNMIVAIQDL